MLDGWPRSARPWTASTLASGEDRRPGARPAAARAGARRGRARARHAGCVRSVPRPWPPGVRRAARRAPAEVVALLTRAGGVASLAHPGKLRPRRPSSASSRTTVWPAVEVFHPDHDEHDVAHYLPDCEATAIWLVTGGSDYHGPGSGRASCLGRVGLPAADFDRAGRARRTAARGRDGRFAAVLEIAGLVKQYRRSGAVAHRAAHDLCDGDRADAFGPGRARGRDASCISSPAPRCPTRARSWSPATTRATIATDTEWLTSLDRFGIVTHRAVLLDKMTIAANLALPLTVAIDPLSSETRARRRAGSRARSACPQARLDDAAASLIAGRARARAPGAGAGARVRELLLLEHPTAADRGRRRRRPISGATLRRAADARGTWLDCDERRRRVRACRRRAAFHRRLEDGPIAGEHAVGERWT